MKNNFKFFSIVLVLLLASSIVLMGCMYAVAAENGDAKVYDMGSQISTNSNIIADDDTPTSQSELQKKFSAMYDISEDGKTVTVISEEYLNDFWQSNYEKEVIHSLTTEEVYFIIQDSIRIYSEYEKIILTGFNADVSDKAVDERFPCIEDDEIFYCLEKSSIDKDEAESAIHSIIIYRLRALSSPKAFFTGADAIRFVGDEPAKYSSMYPEAVFYIPGYSFDTDRDYILSIMGGNTNFTDLERFSDLFMVSIAGEPRIEFGPMQGSGSLEVFPTEEMADYDYGVADGIFEADTSDKVDVNESNDNIREMIPYFKFDISSSMCSLVSWSGDTAAVGSYIQENDAHILYFDGDYRYVFYYNTGVGFKYVKEESIPVPGYEFESGQMFYLFDNLLKPTEK